MIIKFYTMNIDKFVINLKESTERKNTFIFNNNKFIKNYSFFEAVNGNDMDENDKDIIMKNSLNYSKGAIGCALSHLSLWNKCIELNKDIMILEDDVIVSKDFETHLQTVRDMLPENWDILQLSYNFDSILCYNITSFETCNSVFSQTKLTEENYNKFVNSDINPTIAKLKHCFGTSAYLISPNGALKLKKHCFPLRNININIPFIGSFYTSSIDSMMNCIYKDINAYVCLNPFIITPLLSNDYKSTIN